MIMSLLFYQKKVVVNFATTDADRPQEGDLIYHPIITKIFEVAFVDHDEPFYQLDNNPVYKIRCKQFEYSQEAIDTGITEIDVIESSLSTSTSEYQFTLEQSSAVNENIRLEFNTDPDGLLLEETDGEKILGEDDETSVGENILLENDNRRWKYN